MSLQIEEEEKLMQELKKIEQRKKEREKKTLDLQKLITAADSNADPRRPERKTTKKMIICKVKDTSVCFDGDCCILVVIFMSILSMIDFEF